MTMLLAIASGLLALLIVAPVIRRTMRTSRHPSPRNAPAIGRRVQPDYAALLDSIARQVRSGSSLTSAVVDEIDRGTPLGVVAERLGADRCIGGSRPARCRPPCRPCVDGASTLRDGSPRWTCRRDTRRGCGRSPRASRGACRTACSRVAGAAQRARVDHRSIGVCGMECGGQSTHARHLPVVGGWWHLRIVRPGTEPGGLAVDEANDRADMTLSTGAASTGSFALVMLVAWRARPRPDIRRIRLQRSRPWLWGVPAAAIALFSPALGVMAAVALLIGRQWSSMHRRARTARRVTRDFPDALDLLVLSIRAGYLPAQAIVEIVPFLPQSIRAAFAAVDDAMQRGDRFADALGRLHTQLGAITQPLIDSLSAADRYGLPLAPVLERLSLEARQQRRRDTDATAREVRLAMPLVLCTLPSFVLLAIVPLLLGALSSLRT